MLTQESQFPGFRPAQTINFIKCIWVDSKVCVTASASSSSVRRVPYRIAFSNIDLFFLQKTYNYQLILKTILKQISFSWPVSWLSKAAIEVCDKPTKLIIKFSKAPVSNTISFGMAIANSHQYQQI